jgi:DNA-binding NarL/FixJ family response regulator
MDKKNPMPLLLIEDDVAECINFKTCVANRSDVVFVKMTSSGPDGIKYVKTHLPEGIILDLELHKGTGSGLQFLADIKKIELSMKPLIVITTNSPSSVVYNHVHDMGADLVFYKRQTDYSHEMVINTLLALRKSLYEVGSNGLSDDLHTIESPEEQRERIAKRIDIEMDLIGISVRYRGHTFIKDAVLLLLSKEKGSSEAVLYQVAEKNRTSYNNVLRAIQTAINKAWSISSIEDLQKHYTARININTGVPSSTEFVYYYCDKIRKTM